MARSADVAGTEVALDHWIGGQRVASRRTFTDRSPIDESVLGEVARGGADDVDEAVRAARRAFPAWASRSVAERAETLREIAEGIDKRIEQLALVETTDNGSLLRSGIRGVMPRAAHNFRFFADWSERLAHDDFDTRGHRNHVSWDPAGVAALITPWNAPLMLATWKVAPALAAGDTVVLKPAEWSPLTASLLADIAAEAGLPDGVLNVVQGIGEEAGAALVAHPGVDRISFTGSVPTARLVGDAAARNITPVSLELGGKSPYIVFADADLGLAVDKAVGQYDNAGQVCLAGTRLLVEDAVFDEFSERFLAKASDLVAGDPRDDTTDLGPLITREHFERVDGYVGRAVADGAQPVIGGGPNTDLGGLHYRPTLFVEPPAGAEILRDEVFGPVLTLQRFSGEEDGLALANDTPYGLAAVVMTGDPDRAERVSQRLVAGTVWVNCFFVRDLRAPFGGSRDSGIGREGGDWSFDFYCDVKNTVFAPDGWRDEDSSAGES